MRLIYTTESCGKFKFHTPATREEFDKIIADGFIDATPGDVDRDHPGFRPTIVVPHYVQLLEEEDNFDFLIPGRRENTSMIAAGMEGIARANRGLGLAS